MWRIELSVLCVCANRLLGSCISWTTKLTAGHRLYVTLLRRLNKSGLQFEHLSTWHSMSLDNTRQQPGARNVRGEATHTTTRTLWSCCYRRIGCPPPMDAKSPTTAIRWPSNPLLASRCQLDFGCQAYGLSGHSQGFGTRREAAR